MIGIYKITSPTGKVYVGSSTNIEKRFNRYKIKHCKQQIKLYNSLMKHGVSSHIFEVVTECALDDLRRLEAYYGNLFNVLDSKVGLNLRLPGTDEFPQCVNEESKKNISKGVLQSYDRRGRVTDNPEYHQERLAKKRIREKKKYSETKAVPLEQQPINRSKASLAGWDNPDRQVKRSTAEQKKYYHAEYLKAWRKNNVQACRDWDKKNRDAKKSDPEYIAKKKEHNKSYREKRKDDPDYQLRKAIANKKWYEKKKSLP